MRPVVIGSLIHLIHAILESGSAFIEDNLLVKPECNTTHTLNIYGCNIDVSFVLRSKGTLVFNSSSSIFNRTSPSLLLTFVVDTLLNFPIPFNVIFTYTNTSRVNAFRRLLVNLLTKASTHSEEFRFSILYLNSLELPAGSANMPNLAYFVPKY